MCRLESTYSVCDCLSVQRSDKVLSGIQAAGIQATDVVLGEFYCVGINGFSGTDCSLHKVSHCNRNASIIWAVLCEIVPNVLSRCHNKRKMCARCRLLLV